MPELQALFCFLVELYYRVVVKTLRVVVVVMVAKKFWLTRWWNTLGGEDGGNCKSRPQPMRDPKKAGREGAGGHRCYRVRIGRASLPS